MTERLETQRRRCAVLAGASLAAVLIGAPAFAQAPHALHIPAGSLDAALLSLAAQTHEQLLYPPNLVAGRRARALDGAFTTEQALQRLLSDGEITVRRMGPAVLVLKSSTAQATPASAPGPETAPGPGEGARPFADEPAGRPAGQASSLSTHPASGAAGPLVESVQVTGSHIRGAEVASPLVVVTRADIERSGRTTVAEALKTLPENFGGGAADGNSSTGADRVGRNGVFGTGLNLRGLGNNATLVLVNGRRLGGSGAFGDFTDISTLPTAAVDRVEVLLDGASALYGSDAVGGVVNIILRKTYEGAETHLTAGAATDGRGAPREAQFAQTFGHRWATGGVLMTLEANQRDALNGAARPFAGNADLRPLGGTDQRVTFSFPGNILIANPATGVTSPAFAIPGGQNGVGLLPGQLLPGVINLQNQRFGFDILPRQTTQGAYLALDQQLGDRLEITADARYGLRRYRVQGALPISQLTVTRANPFFVSPIGATSESIAYAFADLPFPVQRGSAETFSTTFGGTLKLARDWRAEGYLAYAQEIDLGRSAGNLHSTNLSEALGTIADQPGTAFSTAANGFYNPFSGVVGANSPAILAFIGSGSTYIRATDQVTSANLQADGPLWSLPAGAVKLAAGVQVRQETFRRGGFNFVSGLAPSPSAKADAERQVTAAFAELQVPLFGPENRRPGVERLELSLAARVEHYEAIGSTANPKVGILWAPLPDLHLRATYGTSFRAPALRELNDTAVYSPSLLALGTDRVRVLQLAGGNPGLRPETAVSWTAGADWSPTSVPGLTLGLTGFDIRFRDRIAQPVQQNLPGVLSDPTLASFVTRIAPGVNAADLALISTLLASPALNTVSGVFPASAYGAIVDARFVNTATLAVRGFDLKGAYHLDLGADRLAITGAATYTLAYDQQLTPTSTEINKAGILGFPARLRGRATVDWTHGQITAGAALNYTGAYKDPLGVRIDAGPTVDLQLRRAPAETGPLKGLAATLSVRNVFNRAPPFYNNPQGIGYDPANGDPVGRFVTLQLTRAW